MVLEENRTGNNIGYIWQKWEIFAEEVLNKEKAPALINTLLELLKYDNSISYIFYGNQFIPKQRLFWKSCTSEKNLHRSFSARIIVSDIERFSPASAGEIQLLIQNSYVFVHFFLGNKKNPVFWNNCEELKHQLNLEITALIEESLFTNSKYCHKSSMHYPLQIVFENEKFSSENLIAMIKKHIFLYGSGAAGKSTILQQLQDENCFFLELNQYHREIHEEILPDVPCWILIQVLLKYYYQYIYYTFEICVCRKEKKRYSGKFQNYWNFSEIYRKSQSEIYVSA